MRSVPVNRIDAHIGGRMKARREALGISTHRMATALSTTVDHVARMEEGTMRISAEDLMRVTRELGVAARYFFDDLEPDRR